MSMSLHPAARFFLCHIGGPHAFEKQSSIQPIGEREPGQSPFGFDWQKIFSKMEQIAFAYYQEL